MSLPWYAWLAAGAVAFTFVSIGAWYGLRRSDNGRRFLSLTTRQKLRFFRLLLRDPRTPRAARWLAGLVALYLLSPIDFVPDFIPILGQADDVAIVLLAVCAVIALLPRELVASVLESAARDAGDDVVIARR